MYKEIYNHLKLRSGKLKTDLRLFEVLNQSVPVLMGVFIFFNPFPHTTSIKETCYYLSVLIVLVLLLFKKIEFSFKTPLLLPFSLFVFWAFLGLFFALDKQNSIHDFRAHLLKYIILYYILINYFNSKKRLAILSWIIISSATIFSAGGLFYYYVMLGNRLSTRFAFGLFSEIPTNLIGITTVFAVILSLHHFFRETHLYRKTMVILFLIPLFSATFLTQARGTMIAMSLAFFVLFSRNKRTLIAFCFVLLMIAYATPIKSRFAIPNSIFHNERITQYYIAFEIIRDYPIIGTGYGMQTYGNKIDLHAYYAKIPDEYKSNIILVDPHNIISSVAVRVGFVGLALFCYIILIFLKMCWKGIKHGKDDFIKSWGRCIASAFTSFFVIGIFEPVFSHVPEVVFFVIFSMATILWRLNDGIKSP